jgi:hypothetical protein
MRIDIEHTARGKLSFLKLSHKGKELIWNASTYDRTNFADIDSLFKEINSYFAYLPDEAQDAIWSVYEDSWEILETTNDPNRLHQKLQKEVKKLYEYIKFEDLKRWSLLYANIALPTNLKNDYGPGDVKQRTKDKTYLRDDYYDLAVLTIMLRPMVPIFGQYIKQVGKEVGTNFKEHVALGLLSKSGMLSSPVVQRLRTYVEATVKAEEHRDSAVLGGLGSAELPDWLLSKAIVRRVTLGEINNPGNSIISNVYHTIDQLVNSMDRNFSGRVNPKKPYTGGNEEDNVSVAENYKVKQEISDGDLCVLSVYTQQMYDMVGRVDPTVDQELLNICAANANQYPRLKISQHHITLCQWVLATAISPRGIPSLNKPSLLRSIAATQSLLWHWDFKELAVLMFAEEVVYEEVGIYGAADDSTNKLSMEYVRILTEKYPHYQRQGGKDRKQQPRQVNVACKAIDKLSKELVANEWHLCGPERLLNELEYPGSDVPFIVPSDIRTQLADLIIKITP